MNIFSIQKVRKKLIGIDLGLLFYGNNLRTVKISRFCPILILFIVALLYAVHNWFELRNDLSIENL